MKERGNMKNLFYQWQRKDFVTIAAYALQAGDQIAYGYGGNTKYGAITIDDVSNIPG